jgi:hypothetical protein
LLVVQTLLQFITSRVSVLFHKLGKIRIGRENMATW